MKYEDYENNEFIITFVNNIINKSIIITLFNRNIKNKEIIIKNTNKKHCGKEGHWLELNMGLKINGKNAPDINGFEMKNQTKAKITFIDKVPSDKFYNGEYIKPRDKKMKVLFWNTFKRQKSKGIRIGGWNLDNYDIDGQCMIVDKENNIKIIYNYNYDKRHNKAILVSEYYKNNNEHIIIIWKKEDIEKTINNKWNQKRFFICKKNKETNLYDKICFGNPITFNYWIQQIKQKNIIYDGYSELKGRWRGCFRAYNEWWDKHITQEF